MRRKDGTRFFAGGVTTALHGAGGELIGFTKVMRDRLLYRPQFHAVTLPS